MNFAVNDYINDVKDLLVIHVILFTDSTHPARW